MTLRERLVDLMGIPGLSGHEDRVRRRIARIIVPQRTPRRFYGHGVPNVDLDRLAGRLIVVEGADGSGRSTQIERLVTWLETSGHEV